MIKDRIDDIREVISEIKGQAFEDSGVTLIAVSKNKTVDDIREAMEAGITDIGENKVQELCQKMDEIGDNLNYHMIGNLQSNKVKDIVGRVKLIHSVDRKSLVKEIEKRCKREGIVQDVLVQVNISKEDTKSGVYVEDLKELLDFIETKEHIKVRGLMTMAPYYDNPDDAAWVFAKLKEIFEDIKTMNYNNIEMEYLSMGMSHDYKIALENGANMIRVGSYIFGERVYN
ncbi:MAG: YggS family pyridoxal phosphate-dependent enzyme [Tissierellia bacterium]|nr:YggS family pyridoxal phosphate-dependent enzyme [Tissierellia bacterium]